MISEQLKQAVITDGVAFLRTITKCYGAEAGMTMWSQISGILDPAARDEMFVAMIIGGEIDTVATTITVDHIARAGRDDPLQMIRAIRTVTGCSLLEARNQVDLLRAQIPVTLNIQPGSVAESCRVLRQAGAVI